MIAATAATGAAAGTGGISSPAGVIAMLAAYFAIIVFGILFGGFLGAYQTTSFYSFYEYLEAASQQSWADTR